MIYDRRYVIFGLALLAIIAILIILYFVTRSSTTEIAIVYPPGSYQVGATGPAGATGSAGATGATGATGAMGATGAIGPVSFPS